MDGATYILRRLVAEGGRHFFTVPGAHIDPLFRASGAVPEILPIVCSNEGSAGYMADGYGRVRGTMGILVTHGAPGTHNAATAVCTAAREHIPLLLISGDVPVDLQNRLAFHNAGDIGTRDDALVANMTRFFHRVTDARELPRVLEQAIAAATTEPYGPVHLIVPYDVLEGETDLQQLLPALNRAHEAADRDVPVDQLLDHLRSSRRVVLWVGDSLNHPGVARDLVALAERFAVPVITTYGAKGVIPEDHALSFGNLGFGGDPRAQALLENGDAEVIVALDVDWSERNTANWASLVACHPEIHAFHRFPPEGEAGHGKLTVCDVRRLLEAAAAASRGTPGAAVCRWGTAVKESFSEPPPPPRDDRLVEPDAVVRTMREALPRDTILFVDSGLHRVFAGRRWKAYGTGAFFSSSIVAATGWGVAAGIGAQLEQDRRVVVLTGDGCMRMSGMEIVTAVKYEIPVTVVVLDNGGFASVNRRITGSVASERGDFTVAGVDWAALARALGAEGHTVESLEELVTQLTRDFTSRKPRVLAIPTPLCPHVGPGIGNSSAYAQ